MRKFCRMFYCLQHICLIFSCRHYNIIKHTDIWCFPCWWFLPPPPLCSLFLFESPVSFYCYDTLMTLPMSFGSRLHHLPAALNLKRNASKVPLLGSFYFVFISVPSSTSRSSNESHYINAKRCIVKTVNHDRFWIHTLCDSVMNYHNLHIIFFCVQHILLLPCAAVITFSLNYRSCCGSPCCKAGDV